MNGESKQTMGVLPGGDLRLPVLFKPLRRTYTDLTRDHQSLPESRARESALMALLYCTVTITVIFFLLLLFSYFADDHSYVLGRTIVNGFAAVYMVGALILAKRGYHSAAAVILLSYYITIVSLSAWNWGINASFTILVMGMTIVLGGILLAARYSLIVAGILSFVVLGIQVASDLQIHRADYGWQKGQPSVMPEALAYSILFAVLAIIGWLFGSQIERSLHQARQAEAALLEEKRLLSVRLKERTEKLRAVQLKEMQQLYRFAELGQMSTALLHDLSNQLTILSLDIEGIERERQAASIHDAKQSMAYLDDMVAKVSTQLREKGEVRPFDCAESLKVVIATLRPRFAKEQVSLKFKHVGSRASLQLEGDSTRFEQIMTILTANALDATRSSEIAVRDRRVEVSLSSTKSAVEVTVSDWGVGIDAAGRKRLFKPFYSTKASGMGVGLFITRQILQTHFKGTIKLAAASRPTTFVVRIPRR